MDASAAVIGGFIVMCALLAYFDRRDRAEQAGRAFTLEVVERVIRAMEVGKARDYGQLVSGRLAMDEPASPEEDGTSDADLARPEFRRRLAEIEASLGEAE